MAYVLDGKKLDLDRQFVHPDGRQFSKDFLRKATEQERASIGVTWVEPEAESESQEYDRRFYWGPDKPKNLEPLKQRWMEAQSLEAQNLLAPSDWRVVKARELGDHVDREWFDYRREVRKACNERQEDILNQTDVEGLKALIENPEHPWPEAPAIDYISQFEDP